MHPVEGKSRKHVVRKYQGWQAVHPFRLGDKGKREPKGREMEGWKDGRVEGWKIGRVEGWKG